MSRKTEDEDENDDEANHPHPILITPLLCLLSKASLTQGVSLISSTTCVALVNQRTSLLFHAHHS